MPHLGSGILLDNEGAITRVPFESTRQYGYIRRGARFRWWIGQKDYTTLDNMFLSISATIARQASPGYRTFFNRKDRDYYKMFPYNTGKFFKGIRQGWAAGVYQFERSSFVGRSWSNSLIFRFATIKRTAPYARYLIKEMQPTETLIKKRGYFVHRPHYLTWGAGKQTDRNPPKNVNFDAVPISMKLVTVMVGYEIALAIKRGLNSYFKPPEGDIQVRQLRKPKRDRGKRPASELEKFRDSLRASNKRLSRNRKRKKRKKTDAVGRRYRRHPPRSKHSIEGYKTSGGSVYVPKGKAGVRP